jgi:hypothetical protein
MLPVNHGVADEEAIEPGDTKRVNRSSEETLSGLTSICNGGVNRMNSRLNNATFASAHPCWALSQRWALSQLPSR